MPEKPSYRFGPYRIDVPLSRLERNGSPIPLPPKAFDLLARLSDVGWVSTLVDT